MRLGLSAEAIKHRLRRGRLHVVHRGVYAVGTGRLTQRGHWMAAVLALGEGALLSHRAAGALYEVCGPGGPVDITVTCGSHRSRPGITVHRVSVPAGHRAVRGGIPVTSILWTLVDLAAVLPASELEDAVNAADRLDLIDPERLERALERVPRRPGKSALRKVLTRHTRTDSRLERRLLTIVRDLGLPEPLTQQWVNGHRVDFYWPDLGLIVEADGLRYHRTPAQQARDMARMQDHVAAGMTPVRFTRDQVTNQPQRVRTTLLRTVSRLST